VTLSFMDTLIALTYLLTWTYFRLSLWSRDICQDVLHLHIKLRANWTTGSRLAESHLQYDLYLDFDWMTIYHSQLQAQFSIYIQRSRATVSICSQLQQYNILSAFCFCSQQQCLSVCPSVHLSLSSQLLPAAAMTPIFPAQWKTSPPVKFMVAADAGAYWRYPQMRHACY